MMQVRAAEVPHKARRLCRPPLNIGVPIFVADSRCGEGRLARWASWDRELQGRLSGRTSRFDQSVWLP
eukprot:1930312-Alexandrium_andersonii.AAC.1